jgi:hypothetical protein
LPETENRSKATPKLPGGITGKGFVKGFDPKRYLGGRPKSFDQFRALAQQVANEELTLPDGEKITVAEALLRECAKSREPALIKTFFEYAFGKVPDKIEGLPLKPQTTLILHYGHEREQGQRLPPNVSQCPN